MMRASFPQFSLLPAEIRCMIWTFSMPPAITPTLKLWNSDWYPQTSYPEAGSDSFDIHSYVQAPTPSALHVNREAREVVLAWARQWGLTMQLREETQGHIFVRKWDRELDPLYVSREDWKEFCDLEMDPLEYGVEEEDWMGPRGLTEFGNAITQLALPAFTAYFSIETLASVVDLMPNLRKIHVVWGDLPMVREMGGKNMSEKQDRQAHGVQPRWELVPETSPVVEMVTGIEGGEYEEGGLEMYMEEIDDMWTDYVPPDGEEWLFEHVPVRVIEAMPTEWRWDSGGFV